MNRTDYGFAIVYAAITAGCLIAILAWGIGRIFGCES